MSQRIFFVLPGADIPDGADTNTMGSKAYGLLRLARLGLPVPPAFVLSTSLCREYFARKGHPPADLQELLGTGLARLEQATGKQFGSERRPLLVSVRSGAPVSMPGMMDTLLNVGLCEANIGGLLRATGNPRLVRDCYRRLIRDFTTVVHGAPATAFDAIEARECALQNLASPRELDSAALGRIGQESVETALALSGEPFPQSPLQQLRSAVEAVFRSWSAEKARHYRHINHIDDSMGTAVTVQAMVYGNSGTASGAGVGFTRDPSTGDNQLYLDFLFNAQGEDVVSGHHNVGDTIHLARRLPLVAAELSRIKTVLESTFHDAQDFEFTVEDGKLHLLQTRTAKRTPWAALRIAVDLVSEGIITPAEALARLEGLQPETLERVHLDTTVNVPAIASAVPAGLGVAAGSIVFDARRAAAATAAGRSVLLVRPDMFTEDIEGIAAAQGVLTSAGGRTSHASVVARQLGKVCLVGCTSLRLEPDGTSCRIGESRFVEGDELTLDGNTGKVYPGRLAVVRERPEADLARLADWRAKRAVS
jgi:pyruvate, orthophosphate dikinase